MTDPENKNQAKGFKGLQSSGSKSSDPPALPERKANVPELPPAWEEDTTQDAPTPVLTQSQTEAPPWRGWVIGLGILGAIALLIVWAGNQSSSSAPYSPSSAAAYSPTVPEPSPVEAPPGPTITMPPVGNGLVLTSDQIRYCVYEDRRVKGAERAVNNYDQASVNTFNDMVDDYNSRCSHFQYRQGALVPIQSEADLIQAQLEQEGRERMIPTETYDPAAAAADAAAAAADAAAADAASAAPDTSVDANEFLDGNTESDGANRELDTAAPTEPETRPEGDAYLRTYETSFDCGKARSIPEYLICHDPLLSEDDRELAQLYLQAKASVTDSAGLTDRMRGQWNYREKNCRDKHCLSDWYVSQKDVMRKVSQTGDAYAQ